MEYAARMFARKVLALHVLLLGIIVALVVMALVEVYRSSRQQAINQATTRQEILSEQMSTGIEQYYRSILADLTMLKRAEEDPQMTTTRTSASINMQLSPAAQQRLGGRPPPFRFGRVLWKQLEGRASHLFAVFRDQPVGRTGFPDAEEAKKEIREITEKAEPWLKTVKEPTIGPFENFPSGQANLIAIPVMQDFLIVAVVPVKTIQENFLAAVNQRQGVAAWLLDDNANVMATFDPSLVGKNIALELNDASLRALTRQTIAQGKPASKVFYREIDMAGVKFKPSITNMHPVEINGKKWWIIIASSLDDVNAVVLSIYRRALFWAVFVIVSMTGVLVSTAVQMIRSRVRLERVRHEILQKEISQARQIQLAWLPQKDHPSELIDIAALNAPAHHISGDFYNWFDLPDGRVALCIGDVTGHGMAAAFLMATTQLLVRTTLQRIGDPGKCLTEVNRQLCGQAFAGQFVTMLLIVIDPQTRRMELAAAGHFPPLVSDGAAFYALPMEPQLVLGIDAETEYPTERTEVKSSTTLVLFTDGVIDAIAPDGARFGMAGLQTALANRINDPKRVVASVLDAVNSFRADRELADDLTLLAIRVNASAAAKHEPVAQISSAGT